jgi:MFS transporter, PAT family, beta-lactamase induction signal transducer AmpG
LSNAEQPAVAGTQRRGWLAAVLVYRQPRILSMLLLGFSAGLPFFLVFQTLSAWLRQDGIQRATIGMLAWVGIVYTIKFLWAPVVDRVVLPVLHRLFGRRRSWMLLAQAGIAIGLFNLSLSDPSADILRVALWALFVAFCAATQDIAIDAWRIESAPPDMQGAMAAAYQLGYRLALMAGSAGALTIAAGWGWQASYTTMAALVGVGVLTTLASREPDAGASRDTIQREERVIAWLEQRAHWPHALRTAGAWFVGAVICPLIDFFGRMGWTSALLILLFMGSYRLTDFTMGSMMNPFYIDKGYTLAQIATVVKVFGIATSMVGIVIAGIVIAKLGILRALVLGSCMVIASNLGFAGLATTDTPTLVGLAAVNSLDNLALAMHGTSLIAFLSSLTSPKYTATQYALFSSLYALPGKILEGTSGFVVDAIGYDGFFVYTASLSLPGLLLLYVLARRGAFYKSRGDGHSE